MRLKTIYYKLISYPSIGRAISSFFGLLEVPILELIRLTRYQNGMKYFLSVYKSQVIPINTSVSFKTTISPTEEILGIIDRMDSVAIGYCYCRSTKKNCNNEVWACIHVGTAQSIKRLEKKLPLKSATHDQVKEIVKEADRKGLIHQLLTAPTSEYFYVICNCCSCCCVMLDTAIKHPSRNVVLSSNFITIYNEDKCINCLQCALFCKFGALKVIDDQLYFDESFCVGCGLCITRCDQKALELIRRK